MQEQRRSRAVVLAAVLGFFVVTLDAVIVNIALSAMQRNLGGGISGLQWVVDGYTLMFAALLLSAGALSDRIGAARSFRGGIAVFVAASMACGAAPTLGVLIAARFLQGAAAAVMMPASMSLIGQSFPDPQRRARAIGMWAMGGAVASTSGPLLGGLLTVVSWRLIFFVNVPVGLVAALMLRRIEASPRASVRLDLVGQVLGCLAMGALVYVSVETGALGLTSAPVLGSAALAVGATAGFFVSQRRAKRPMMPLQLFRSRNLSVSVFLGFAFMVAYYGLPFVMGLYLQSVRGLSPFATGLVFLPMMLVGAALTPLSARIAERVGVRALVGCGLAAMAAGLLSIALFPSASTWLIAISMLCVGLGGPTVSPPTTTVLLSSVPSSRSGIASGVYNTSRQIGGALAVAVFGA
ncbi:MAG: MFS transporter, partial [Actinomycetota bacterium]|nr:MFS transporter [Actinomycetota bacterium]